MDERLQAAWVLLPEYLGWHVVLSASALALGFLIAAPLAVLASRNRPVRTVALGLAGLVQTIPSLALLALFFPLLVLLSSASEAALGLKFSALGFLPSLLALTLYSMLPILRNGVAALQGVGPGLRDAAFSLGLSPTQRLWLVEAPVAAPVFMAGVRTAAVWVVGTATLATPVGQTSLGNYIFTGLQTENWVAVLFGCAASAALALIADGLLALVERGAASGAWRLAGGALAGLAVGTALAATPLLGKGEATYVVGAKNFSEQFILAEVMADRLKRTGAKVRRSDGLGSAVAFRALASNEIDVYVDYSGTLWTNVLHRTDTPSREVMLAELGRELERRYGVRLLGPLGFENAYALAMTSARAKALGVSSIADLAARAPSLTMGGDVEFFSRSEWAALDRAYGLQFRTKKSFQPTFMYRALASGDADVISAFSSDGRIAADHLVILADPKHAIPPYDAVILIAPRRAHDGKLEAALKPLVGAIPVAAMQRANYAVDGQGRTPAEAAKLLTASPETPPPTP
ncbi:MAG: ABC transporter permease subunit [Proteobacteria bacterium]|nr:ABC transporter permease subunit [Pseudomonadota bacterium]